MPGNSSSIAIVCIVCPLAFDEFVHLSTSSITLFNSKGKSVYMLSFYFQGSLAKSCLFIFHSFKSDPLLDVVSRMSAFWLELHHSEYTIVIKQRLTGIIFGHSMAQTIVKSCWWSSGLKKSINRSKFSANPWVVVNIHWYKIMEKLLFFITFKILVQGSIQGVYFDETYLLPRHKQI